jgi:hypothetical protein
MLRTQLYDKRDDFNFLIVNFPFIWSNVPATSAYGLYISQLIRYSRACGSYHEFLVFKKFYGRLNDLVNHYGISVLQMTTDMFRLSKLQYDPFLVHYLLPGL